jgi:hypothetical protein
MLLQRNLKAVVVEEIRDGEDGLDRRKYRFKHWVNREAGHPKQRSVQTLPRKG